MVVQQVDVWTCDNPDCGTRFEVTRQNEPEGYKGTAQETQDADGETHVTWFACSPDCIGEAVSHRLVPNNG